MFEAENVFGPVSRLQARSVGEPGQRRFFIGIESDQHGSARLWLEKEQLQALGLALEQMLAEVQGRLATSGRASPTAPDPFPEHPNLDFQIGRLALGQDESELESGPRYVLMAYDMASGPGEEQEEPTGPATFACRATREQLRVLSRNISDVVSAGRPRCPLCGEPVPSLDQPHGCVRTNGHHT